MERRPHQREQASKDPDFEETRFELESEARSSLNDYAQFTIKALVIVNAGAVLAMLSFVGSVFKGPVAEGLPFVHELRGAFRAFLFGMTCAILCSGAAYVHCSLLVWFWKKQKDAEFGKREAGVFPNPYSLGTLQVSRMVVIIFCISSMMSFLSGGWLAIDSLTTYGTNIR